MVEFSSLPLLLGVLMVSSVVETAYLPLSPRLGGTEPLPSPRGSVGWLCWLMASILDSWPHLPSGRKKLRCHVKWAQEVEAVCAKPLTTEYSSKEVESAQTHLEVFAKHS